MNVRLFRIAACAWLAVAGFACAPGIGDECETALNCSAQATRVCDRTQPHGYCTIRGCERGTCPEDSVCVKFRPSAERLAVTYCMATCDEDDDCRNDEGYECTRAANFGDDDNTSTSGPEAEILGRSTQKFCSTKPLEPPAPMDAGSDDDAGSEPNMSIDDTDAGNPIGNSDASTN